MGERIRADHPSVDTVRATIEQVGRTSRSKIHLPAETPISHGMVRLILQGTIRRSPVERTHDDDLVIIGAYDTPEQARQRSGENRLQEWIDEEQLEYGRSVLVDMLEREFCYGVRVPGEDVVYEVPDRPDSSLTAIADELADGQAGDG